MQASMLELELYAFRLQGYDPNRTDTINGSGLKLVPKIQTIVPPESDPTGATKVDILVEARSIVGEPAA